jgi:hemerythrin
VPNHFVRTLRDWILSHIALTDKLYAAFIETQKKKGLLSDQEINGLF